MRSLPLPLALTARLAPVAVLATAGWALSSPSGTTSAAGPEATPSATGAPAASAAPSASASATQAAKTYATAPDPCASLAKDTITSLVPGAKTAGKEIASTDA
ncbi:hypothetical protein NGM37_01830, partial [Streptomyces sp. TRM76130]|nr:hypothetical protein [Streptomyces sp. TRM76130]